MRVKLDAGAKAPTRAHKTDAGLDLYSRENKRVRALGEAIFKTGVHVEIPHGCAGLIVSKSGLHIKHGITTTGLIDEGYSGEIVIRLFNDGYDDYEIHAGDKISQLVIIPVLNEAVEIAEEIEEGERGNAGFGSTGK